PVELTEGAAYQSFLSPGDIESPIPTWGTILTSMFIHGGLLHLAGNMMFLWVFGSNIEARLGHLKYVAFYVVTGVAATLCHWVVEPTSAIPLVGASGAIAGVMGAYLLLYPRNRINSLIIFYFITVIRISALWLLGFWFVWQLVQALLSIGISAQVSVAFWAHVGGFVAGAVIIALYRLFSGQPPLPTRGPDPPSRPTRYWRRRPLD
ncbi:MAG: rhomboid family intramembrane serine protease, partial [Chloroflexota bacterium]|nr:rhomboid family intramembrane serine protease [Chloroflexota bacterium]